MDNISIISSFMQVYTSCSNFTIEAINRFGIFKGGFLSIKRIIKCNPWGSHGYDPVPQKEDN